MTEIPADTTICVVGLGYVGLPLAVEFAKVRRTIGFDVKAERISELRSGRDHTLEVDPEELAAVRNLTFTDDPARIAEAAVYIVTVPTPIDEFKRPDLSPLKAASRTVGSVLKPGDVVVYESTVYPGATQEVCVPILSQVSGMNCDVDYSVGYSPERINPGDKAHRLATIKKVTSGSNSEAADFIDALYGLIVTAGTHKASSIRVAEAAKVIENTQRDVNIALINELAILFNKLGIDTHEVLEAAGTKWNFLPFKPGLVGGHCIGVDPYYLTHKAQQVGHHPEVILAGRRINDSMGQYVADQVVLHLARRGFPVGAAKILILGLTFKENCPDVRNTRVVDIITRLGEYGADVIVHDPWADTEAARREYGVRTVELADIEPQSQDALVVAVAHDAFRLRLGDYLALLRPQGVLFDVKRGMPDLVGIVRL